MTFQILPQPKNEYEVPYSHSLKPERGSYICPMIQSDPIVALATPPGVGAISVIRISGDDSLEIISKFFISSSGKILKKQKNQTIHLGEIVENDQIIDQVLVSIFKKPFMIFF